MFIPFAIVDLPLEEAEIGFIALLVIAAMVSGSYFRKLQSELRQQKKQLYDQTEFNRKLNVTVDRLLKIDNAGEIDSNRQSPKGPRTKT